MDTTTLDDGANTAQPIESEAETAEQPQVEEQSASNTNDQPNESTADSTEEPKEAPQEEESQADGDDVQAWAEKKGLPLDDPIKLAKMYRDAEKRMHEATTQVPKTPINPPELLEPTGDENYDQIVERQNVQEQRIYVRDWFDANPDMKEHRDDLSRIASERPWLTNLDDVRAHYLASPDKLKSMETEGGRKALTNLAQKQQQTPPSAGATNANSYATNKLTPQNVDQMVAKMSPEEYRKRLPEINAAMGAH